MRALSLDSILVFAKRLAHISPRCEDSFVILATISVPSPGLQVSVQMSVCVGLRVCLSSWQFGFQLDCAQMKEKNKWKTLQCIEGCFKEFYKFYFS